MVMHVLFKAHEESPEQNVMSFIRKTGVYTRRIDLPVD